MSHTSLCVLLMKSRIIRNFKKSEKIDLLCAISDEFQDAITLHLSRFCTIFRPVGMGS